MKLFSEVISAATAIKNILPLLKYGKIEDIFEQGEEIHISKKACKELITGLNLVSPLIPEARDLLEEISDSLTD